MFSQFKEKLAKASLEASQKLKTVGQSNKHTDTFATLSGSVKQLNEPPPPSHSHSTPQPAPSVAQNAASSSSVHMLSTHSLQSNATSFQIDANFASPPYVAPPNLDILSSQDMSSHDVYLAPSPPKNPSFVPTDPNLYPECLIPLPESPPPPRYQAELQSLRSKVQQLQAAYQASQTALKTQKQHYEKHVNDLTQRHAHAVSEAKATLQSKTHDLETHHQKELSDLREKHHHAMTELQRKQEKQVSDIQGHHQSTQADMQAKHQTRLSEMQTQHQQAMTEVTAKHQSQSKEILGKHQEEVRQLQSKLDTLSATTVTKAEHHRLQQDLGVLQASYQRTANALMEQEAKVKQAVVAEALLKKTLSSTESQLGETEGHRHRLQTTLDELQSKHTDLTRVYQTTLQHAQGVQEENERLKKRIDELEMEGKAAEAKHAQTVKLLQRQKTSVPENVQAQIVRLTSELDAKSNLLHQYMQKETQGNLDRTFAFGSSPSHVTEHTSSQLQKLSHARLVEVNLKLQTLLEEQTLKANQLQEDVARLNSSILSQQIGPVPAVAKKSRNDIGHSK